MGLLDISGNLYTSIELPAGDMWTFHCNESQLTELNLSNVTFNSGGDGFVDIKNNSQLQHINLRNGSADYDNDMNYYLDNNPMLQSICADNATEGEFLVFRTFDPNVNYSFYCDFEPATDHNTITGTVNFGAGGACTVAATNVPMSYNMGSTNNGTTYVNSTGGYSIYPYGGTGNATVTPQPGPYFTASPASFTSTFSGFGNAASASFCLSPIGTHPDLEVTLLPLIAAMPGFDAQYQIVVRNKGTQVQSGTVSLAFDDARMDFISATPSVSAQVVNNASWAFSALNPFETRSYNVIFNINSPMETPSVNNGDVLTFTASLATAETDDTPANNTDQFNQVVIGSYDPNDITVLEGATISVSQTSDYLTYVVRFQNSGTAPATNVVVKDMVTNNLNPATMQIVASSHPFRSTLTEGNQLEFFFENIMLPAESADEPGSHGFIAYKMKPQSFVGLGSVMEKHADIFFDYNWPIVTNTATTTVSQLGTNQFADNNMSIYPNPVQNAFMLKGKNFKNIQQLEIYNVVGQKVLAVANPAADAQFDISALNSGTYIVKITSDGAKSTLKLVKQ
jgi:uncharacterized repeat protein (TIGR01451 family)